MPNNIIMQVKVDDKLIVLHPETTASQVKLASGKTLQEYIDEHDVVKVENGRLYRKTENGSYEIVSSVTSEFNLEPATGVSFESAENRVAVKWTDPLDVTIESSTGPIALATWAGTKLVAKVGSPPTNMNDGITLVDSKVRDQYKATAYLGTLDMNKTYYLKLFPYTDTGIDTTVGDSLSATTTNIILDEPTASAVAVDDKAYLTWTDPVDKTASFNGGTVNTAKWLKTVVVKKVGSSPANINDGDLVTEVTTKNLHTTNPFIVSGLAEGLTYFKFFPVTVDGDVTIAANSQYPVTVSYGSLPNATALSITRSGDNASITWTDPVEPTTTVGGTTVKSATWAKSVVVMKNDSVPANINDGTKVKEVTTYNQHKTTALSVIVTKNVTVYFKVFSISTNGKITTGISGSIKIDSVTLPAEVGPGMTTLFAGDVSAGYFGHTNYSALIDGSTLANTVGLSAGTVTNSQVGWLKFIIDGKIIFVAYRPLRINISWNSLKAADLITGNKIVKIGSLYYRVRLMKGAQNNPSAHTDADRDAIGSEWNRLMLPISDKARTGGWQYPEYAGTVPDWGGMYTSTDLDNTVNTWCQENPTGIPGSAVVRGYGSDCSMAAWAGADSTTNYAWRPVLELIQPSEITDNTGTPGSVVLQKGNTKYGYYGEVPSIISTSTLATLTGFTKGTVLTESTTWLKFHSDGKVIFVAKKPLRHSISWNDINEAGYVSGGKTVRINSIDYKLRLLKAPNDGSHDEWSGLIYPLHKDAVVGNTWGINMTDIDLHVTATTVGAGAFSWVQDQHPTNSQLRLNRGGLSVVYVEGQSPGAATNSYSWRPVLEPVNQ